MRVWGWRFCKMDGSPRAHPVHDGADPSQTKWSDDDLVHQIRMIIDRNIWAERPLKVWSANGQMILQERGRVPFTFISEEIP